MPLTRILVALMNMPNEGAALRTVAWAWKRAGSPNGLRFALSRRLEKPVLESLPEMGMESSIFSFYGERGGLANVAENMGDATHFLSLSGEYDFAPQWDYQLMNRYGKIPSKAPLMTAMIGDDGGKTEPQAYLPALSEEFGINGVRLQKGLPLVCSQAPVPTIVVNPSFLMGKKEVLHTMDLRPATLSFAAYVAAVPVYALDCAPLWPVGVQLPVYLERPVQDVLPGTTIARFEQLAGFHYEQKRAGLRTNWGLFTTENTYPQKMPPRKLQIGKLFKSEIEQPVLVTAFVDLPNARKPALYYVLRFGFLHQLQNLPLYLYTGGSVERQLRSMCNNARSYPENNLLPTVFCKQGMSKKDWFSRNKLLLMERIARQHPEMSHVAWVDMDTLRHPVCPDAKPDFSAFMDRHIHIATVHGVPDDSFIIAPAWVLRKLAAEITDRTLLDIELEHNLSHESLLLYLMDKYHDLIQPHPMPAKKLLFATGFDPALLDQRYRLLLSGGNEQINANQGKDLNL